MHALLTEEQESLAELARAVAGRAGIRNPADLATVDRELGWRSLAEAGLLDLRTRREDGAANASAVEVMIVARAVGAALSPVPYVASGALVPELLALAGATEQLAAVGNGSCLYGLALRMDLTELGDPAQADELIVWESHGAEFALGLSTDNGIRVVRVPVVAAPPGLESADPTRSFGRVAAGIDRTIETLGVISASDFERWSALAMTLVCADAVGVMRAALDRVVGYSHERHAYGVPIGSFQAVQHLCAESLVACQAAASLTDYAAWAVDALSSGEALLAARTAKAQVASVGREVTETVAQVYGGIGQTWEHIAHFSIRRALLDVALFGNEDHQLARIADLRLGER